MSGDITPQHQMYKIAYRSAAGKVGIFTCFELTLEEATAKATEWLTLTFGSAEGFELEPVLTPN